MITFKSIYMITFKSIYMITFKSILDWKNFINIKNSAKKKNNSTIHNDTK